MYLTKKSEKEDANRRFRIDDVLLTPTDTAKRLGLIQETLVIWTRTRGFPSPLRHGSRKHGYILREVVDWINAQDDLDIEPTPQPQARGTR
jgi:predicted DNA-binding transcriptional regulator AlpA